MGSSSRPRVFGALGDVWTRRKWLAIAVFLFTAAAGVSVALSLPNIYRSTATVLVEQGKADAGGPGETESHLQLVSQQIVGRSRLEGLIRQYDLYPRLRPHASLEPAVQQMRRDIHTESKLQPLPSGVGATIAFAISYRGPSPEVVAKVANALAESYLEEDQRLRGRQASGAVQVLKGQLEDAKRQLQEQERALGEFQERHLGELPSQPEASLANLERLNSDLRTASDERIRALDRRNELLRELAVVDGGGSSAAAPLSPDARLARKRAELDELRQKYSEKYPDVVRLKQEVAALEREASAADPPVGAGGPAQTGARLRAALKEVEAEIKTLRSDEARLRGAIAAHIQQLENAPRRQRAYQEIARDYQTTRELYDAVRKRYEQAQLEEGPEGGRPPSPFRILDPAIVPTDPVAPSRPVLLLVALLGSLGMVAAAVGLVERGDTSLHTADDVRAFTRVPVLASIPLIVTAGDRRSQRRRFWLAVACLLLVTGVVVRGVNRMARTSEELVSILARGRP